MAHKILIFVPAFGNQLSVTTFLTTHALRETLMVKGIPAAISAMSFPNIGELRDMYLTVFYDAIPDASHLLMIDADMGFHPDLVVDMLLFDEPLVGACYPKRALPIQWTPSGFAEPQAEVRSGFMKVEGVGMGCTLIRRDCVTALIAKFPELVDTRINMHPAADMFKQAGIGRMLRFFDPLDLPDRGILSEDLAFCVRAGKCGITTWANINHRISHVGPYDYAGRYMDMVEEQQKAALEAAQKAALNPPAEAPAPVLQAAE